MGIGIMLGTFVGGCIALACMSVRAPAMIPIDASKPIRYGNEPYDSASWTGRRPRKPTYFDSDEYPGPR